MSILNDKKSSFSELRTYAKINEAFFRFYHSENIQKLSLEILHNFIENYENPSESDMTSGSPTPLDLHTSPEKITDENLKILTALLGYKPKYIHKNEITPRWFSRLNYILEKTYQHFIRDTQIDLSKDLAKYMVDNGTGQQFSVQTKEEYIELLWYLSGLTDRNNAPKTNKKRLSHCSFLKAIYITGHIADNEIIAEITDIFDDIVKYTFQEPFFPNQPIHTWKKNHERTMYHSGILHANTAEYAVTIEWRAKNEQSISDKMTINPEYNNVESFNDIFWFRVTTQNHRQLVEIIYHFLRTIPHLNNGSVRFDSQYTIWIKDKHMLYNTNPHHQANTQRLLENVSTEYKHILETLLNKQKPNGKNARSYKECKLLIPLKRHGIPFSIEVQFVLKGNDNEKWMADHKVYEIRKELTKICRTQKFLTKYDITSTIEKILNENSHLIESIGNGSRELTIDLIIKEFFLEDNFLQERKFTNPDYQESFFIVTDTIKIPEKHHFYPETHKIDTTILTAQRLYEIMKQTN